MSYIRHDWSREKVPDPILGFAREMRKNQTEAESLLWANLRNRKLESWKFRRQQPIEGYILDFYCDQLKLGIEVDGEIHSGAGQEKYDRERSEYLGEFGINVLRFSNDEVTNSMHEVLSKIKEVAGRSPSPLPLSQGRGVATEGSRGEGLILTSYYKFKGLRQRVQWISPAYVGVDASGVVTYLSNKPPVEAIALDSVDGYALPGFQNAHSHAFQYAMAGLAETHPVGTHDDFWSWREAMYQCALSVDPDQVEAIATMLYAEMLRHGYTHVAEFHYLHHDKEGKAYSNLAELGSRMVSAAKTTGIGITLIPVFYQKGTFGQEPQARQRRFISRSVEDYFNLLEASRAVVKDYSKASLAASVHSLRAVDLDDIVSTFNNLEAEMPFHIHVAEQKKEVRDCLSFSGKRPMQWMLDNLPVDDRFHLVHSTHLDDDELSRLAKSGANVVLCPSTEGNLGDGIFRMKEYVKLGGHWSIGTDSHIGINPLEEFRMIDYRQRLITNERNTFEGDAALYMVNEEVASGRKAMGMQSADNFEIGKSLDAVVIDAQAPLISGTSLEKILPSIVYASDSNYLLGTIVNGKWVVKRNRHHLSQSIKVAFAKSLQEIKNR